MLHTAILITIDLVLWGHCSWKIILWRCLL